MSAAFSPEFTGYNTEVLSEPERLAYLEMTVGIAQAKDRIGSAFGENHMTGRDRFLAVWGGWLIEKVKGAS